MLHLWDIIDPAVAAEHLLLLSSEVLLSFRSSGEGLISGTVDVVTALGGIVLALELLHSATPSLAVEDIRPLVLL